jgi:hypothetical protein
LIESETLKPRVPTHGNWTREVPITRNRFCRGRVVALMPGPKESVLNFCRGAFASVGPCVCCSKYPRAEIFSSTAPGLYGFEFGTKEPATLSIEGADGETFVTVMRSFSIRVTNGTAVPDECSSALLLGVSFVSLVVFPVQKWGQCARSRAAGKGLRRLILRA